MSSRTRTALGSLLAAAGLVLALPAATPAGGHEPAPLRGSPLGHTGLRLVVAGVPPFVLDVDTGSVTRLHGVATGDNGIDWVVGLSARAAVVVADSIDPPAANQRLYAVRDGETTVAALGTGRDVVPDATGAGFWVTRVSGRSRCVLDRIELDGRKSVARAIPCSWVIAPASRLGLVVHRTRVVDPRTGRKVFGSRQGILAVAGTHVLLAQAGVIDTTRRTLTLVDATDGSTRILRDPRTSGGLETPVVDPQGRYIALPFGDPSWNQSGTQLTDVWLLDTVTAKLMHLPGMPAFVHLKATSIAWAQDGRLVFLGEDDDRTFVATWRPGQPRLLVKSVHLPERRGGSDSFAPLAG